MGNSYALFNNPLGTKKEQERIITHIIDLINNTPAKETISAGLYSFDDRKVANALLKARERGVRVEIALDRFGEHYSDNKKRIDKGKYENRVIVNMLKDKIDKLTICGNSKDKSIQSCISNNKNSIQHEKYFLFSKTFHPKTNKEMDNTVLITSSNMTNTAQYIQWNDAFVSYGDRDGWYKPWYDNFQNQLNQKRNSSYFNPKLSSGYFESNRTGYEAYFSPSSKYDIFVTLLKKVKGSSNKECSLLLNEAYFTNYRKKVANELIRIKKSGCAVRVLVSKPKMFGKKIRKKLTKAGIEYKYLRSKKQYTHHKFILYRGDYANRKAQNIVWLGSHNLTDDANRLNDEVIVKVSEKHIFHAYKKHFDNCWRVSKS
jgi:phosphatidylserine/phosphatidylglycerophosphate/cardiolipin synthase-like enzyme